MKISNMFLGFGAVCFIAAFVFSFDVSKVESKSLPAKGGTFGPLAVEEKDSTYEIQIANYVALNKWSSIDVEVRDADKKPLFSFGDEMWHESGYDEGHWEEEKTLYTMDITFEEPGQYYFNVSATRNDNPGNAISISAVQKRGSIVPFFSLGIISIILFFVVNVFSLGANLSAAAIYIFGTLFALLFAFALYLSSLGWGYMGYRGYHHGPSFFYYGGPNVYHSPSIKNSSIGGTGHRGGGLSGGK